MTDTEKKDTKKVTYHLYVLKTDKDGLAEAAKSRFSRICDKYVLVYTDKTLKAGEITEKDVWRLNRTETEWLAQCNVQLLMEDAQRRKDEIQKEMSEKIQKLEKELEKQAKRDKTKENI